MERFSDAARRAGADDEQIRTAEIMEFLYCTELGREILEQAVERYIPFGVEYVLVEIDGNLVNVYGSRRVTAKVVNRPQAESVTDEIEAIEATEKQLPLPFKELYWPSFKRAVVSTYCPTADDLEWLRIDREILAKVEQLRLAIEEAK